MSRTRFALAATFLATCAFAACAPVDDAEDEATDKSEEHAYAAAGTVWKSHSIPVCWEDMNPAFGAQREWTRSAVASTWDAYSDLSFTGWGGCSGGDASGIRIRVADEGPFTWGLGTQLAGVPGGMTLNFTFNNWSPVCRDQLEYCVRAIAVHEFGHAIGFAHEQNRADTDTSWCNSEQGGDGDVAIGAWDIDSVMNYCNPRWSGDGNLSATDIQAVQLVYGASGLAGLITNVQSDKCLDVDAWSTEPGAKVISWDCHGGNNQRWHLDPRGDGSYRIVNWHSGKCLDVAGWSTDDGGPIIQWDCHGGNNQAWNVESGGPTRLVSKHSGKCLDLDWGSAAAGARIQQWSCHDGDNQKWFLQ